MTDRFLCPRPSREPWLTAWRNLPDLRDVMDAEDIADLETEAATRSAEQGRWHAGRWP